MNMKKIVILSVISFLVAFSSCNTFKRPLKTHEKIGKNGEDYTISYYELKKEIVGLLHIKVIEDNKSLPSDRWLLEINGVSIYRFQEPFYYLSPNRKYNVRIITLGDHKALYVYNIKVRERDSIVLTLHLKDRVPTEGCR
ncbi:hypothetical protein [Capnocytophaga leadbetteri]|uniref:hypothetical protein n=1 Tax=Capnocytophaga leadbetteri TaxID=327575 RepID=UPI0028D86A97|nr:hypothetical protein [Capnocytophaga leadbetteri]